MKRCAVTILLVATTAVAEGPSSRPCANSLAVCPAYGCAQPGTPAGAANELRRHWPGTARPRVTLSVDDLEALQVQTDARLRQGFAVANRSVLRRIGHKGTIAYGEADIVQLRAYIVGTPHRRRNDSSNCNLVGMRNNNFRIHLASDSADTDFDSIIGEITPYHRPSTWTLPRLRKLQEEKRLLLVTGQLFYDNKHFVNDDPDADLPLEPRRVSLWELHPITEILVCTTTTNDCRPEEVHAWEPLASYD